MSPYASHPKDDMTYACPECDQAGNIYRRYSDRRQGDELYRCDDCGGRFDSPVERKSRQGLPESGKTDGDGLPCGLRSDMKDAIRELREES